MAQLALPCGVLLALALAESMSMRQSPAGVGWRWIGNLGLYALGAAMFRLPLVGGVLVAALAPAGDDGALHHLGLPSPVRFVVALLCLDLCSYVVHVASHAVAPLWRLHAVHHSDPEVDVTTALRHHPGEVLPGLAAVATIAYLLGLTPAEIAAYGLIETIVQMAAHANLAMPARLETALRRVVVTPGFHRLHHSRRRVETDSNYGQVLTLWDRVFGTLAHGRPAGIGLDEFRAARDQRPQALLLQPFLRRTAISR